MEASTWRGAALNAQCSILPQLPGLVLDPLLFAMLAYWLAGLRDDLYAFLMTSAIVVLTMNVSSACGEYSAPIVATVQASPGRLRQRSNRQPWNGKIRRVLLLVSV